jgi:CO dehydrogenase nickel-insertion accessory protein CooC1
MSNPLKIYLSLLDEGKTTVVVDWVAWVDMINFWLYHACDFMVIVAECSRNWIKVAAQIKHLCDMSSVNYWIVLNKTQDNEYYNEAVRIFEWQIITEIRFDQGIFDYNYDLLSRDTLWKIDQIIEYAQQHQWINIVDRMMMLDKIKYDT